MSQALARYFFGEVADDKFFVVAHVSRGYTQVEWRQLKAIRPFVDRYVRLERVEEGPDLTERLRAALPAPERFADAIMRLTVEYPRQWETLIDDAALRDYCAGAFEFQLVKRPQIETRIRLPEDQTVGSLAPLDLLDLYWRASHVDPAEGEALNQLAARVIEETDS